MGSTLCKQEDAAVEKVTRVRPPPPPAPPEVKTDFGEDEGDDFNPIETEDDTSSRHKDKFGAQRAQHSTDTITKRLIIVIKELPVKITRTLRADGTRAWDIAFGDERNFMVNLRGLSVPVVFIGCVSLDVAPEEQEELEAALRNFNCVPVFLEPKLKTAFLLDFCKAVLWSNLHYVLPHRNPSWAKEQEPAWQSYTAANLLFANQVLRVVENASDTIWVHNYHLFLVPSFIRGKRPRVKMGFFIHTPWCSSDVFRVLPWAEAILRGVLSCDLVGFHTFDYVRHFLSCCKRVLQLSSESKGGGRLGVKYNGRAVTILISHLGIEAEFFRNRAQSEEIRIAVDTLRRKVAGRRIVCSMDTLDMVKGSIAKFEMWERFLETHTQFVDQVCFVGYLLPDTDSRQQNFVRETILAQLKCIQDKFGPEVIHLMEVPRVSIDEVITLYRAAEVGLFTTFWDGLNVLPFEFTASQDPLNPGALIVSEFMGCSRSLQGVGRVNPWDLQGTATMLERSLGMTPKDRKGYHELRSNYVMQHNCVKWAQGFLEHLDEAARLVVDMAFVPVGFGSCAKLVGLRSGVSHLDDSMLLSSFKACTRRFFFVDYDGTLTAPSDRGFNGTPENVKHTLEQLCQDPQNMVFIMSGRPRLWIYQQLGYIKELGLAAEKGAFIRWPESLKKACVMKHEGARPTRNAEMDLLWENLAPHLGDTWKTEALEVIEEYTQHTDGSSIEDKDLAIVWHYENADPEFGLLQATEMEKFLSRVIDRQKIDVVLYDYNRIVEVKPVGVNKGATALHILNRVLERQPMVKESVFALVFGDDISDESMFTAVQDRFKQKREQKDEAMAELREGRRTPTPTQRKKDDSAPNTFTCCVGMKASAARYYVQDHDEVIEILSNLGQMRMSRNPSYNKSQGHKHLSEMNPAPGPRLKARDTTEDDD